MSSTPHHRINRTAALAAGAAIAIAAGVAWYPAAAQRAPSTAAPAAQDRPPGQRSRSREAIDPQARQVVERMGDYLGSKQAFQVTADSITEVVLQNGMRLQYAATSNVAVRRPDRLRSERRGELADLVLLYDGDRMTLLNRTANVFATADAPDTLDDAIDFARENLDLEAPGADLLYSEAGESLMEGVQSGMYVGQAEIDGTLCHHVAFREREVDWQLWVQDGEEPLPRRYVIVSKRVRSQPGFTVELRDWDTTSQIDPEQFTFSPPAGAREIPFRGLIESGREAAGGER